MSYGSPSSNLNAYRNVGAYGSVEVSDPHRLVQVMFATALERIAAARGCMERGQVAEKGENVSKAMGIVGGLNDALDLERGGPIAVNLRELYNYRLPPAGRSECVQRRGPAGRSRSPVARDQVGLGCTATR